MQLLWNLAVALGSGRRKTFREEVGRVLISYLLISSILCGDLVSLECKGIFEVMDGIAKEKCVSLG